MFASTCRRVAQRTFADLGYHCGLRAGEEEGKSEKPPRTLVATLVATLAGFQTVDQEDKGWAYPGIFLAANSRIDLGKPFYISLAALACLVLAGSLWLGYYGRTHLAMVSPLRNPNAFWGVTESIVASLQQRNGEGALSADTAKRVSTGKTWSRTHRVLCVLLGVAGLAILAIACFQMPAVFARSPHEGTFVLAHGRDRWALAGLAALYTAIAIVGVWRLELWTQRYRRYRCPGNLANPDIDMHNRQTGEGNTWVAAAAAIIVLLVLAGSALLTRGLIHAVDSPWPSLLMSLFLLPTGAWFLGQFRTHTQRWAQLALMLGRTMDVVAEKTGKATGSKERSWPPRWHWASCRSPR